MYPEPKPRTTEATVKATANLRLTIPEIMINASGLMSGEDVRKAIIGPQGKAVVNMAIITGVDGWIDHYFPDII